MSQTINQEIQLRVGAEDIATLGYQEPQLVLGELGGFALMNKEGKNKTIVNFSDTIRQAWSQLLQTLQERNIPIPDILRSPRFTPVSQDLSAGIFIFPDRIEVSAWGKAFDGTEPYSLQSKNAYNINNWMFTNEVFKGILPTSSPATLCIDFPKQTSGIATTETEGYLFSSNNNSNYIRLKAERGDFKVYAKQRYNEGNPITFLYPLEDAITIPLDTPLDSHLTLHNASDYDVWIPLSEDGQEMYEYIPDYEGTGTHVYHWNRDWVRTVGHQPVALEILNHGWTDRLNAAFLRNLRSDYTQLRRDFDEYRQSHP